MSAANIQSARMPVVSALAALAEVCDAGTIVVTNQSSARIWPKLRQRPLDFHYNPSTMGGAIPLGLGLALAQPARQVVVVSGDGSLLMSLGVLVTVAASGASNMSIVLLDNGLYEVTGGQQTPAARAAVDYVGIARGAGLASAIEFERLNAWQQQAPEMFRLPGPRLVRLVVEETPREYLLGATPPLDKQLADLRGELAAGEHRPRSLGGR